MDKESDFAIAARHVAEGAANIAGQKAMIAKLKLADHSTLDAEQVFESTLRIFEDHEQRLRTVVYTAVADKRIRNIWGK